MYEAQDTLHENYSDKGILTRRSQQNSWQVLIKPARILQLGPSSKYLTTSGSLGPQKIECFPKYLNMSAQIF